jgi:hypothetical protein
MASAETISNSLTLEPVMFAQPSIAYKVISENLWFANNPSAIVLKNGYPSRSRTRALGQDVAATLVFRAQALLTENELHEFASARLSSIESSPSDLFPG